MSTFVLMDKNLLLSELTYKATRSSGAGGQHVNKTSTRVELYWSIFESKAFTADKILRLREKLHNRITKEGMIILASEKSRSQHKNKVDVTNRFLALIQANLVEPKIRKRTTPSRASKLKRLSNKKAHSEKKANRRKPDY